MLSPVIDHPAASLHHLPSSPASATKTPPLRTFRHTIDIYLKDSNAYTNTYFSRYFEWQGICRERWFHACIAPDMLQSQGLFITKRAHTEYLHETFPFQSVDCELNSFDIRHCSFYLVFRFLVEGTVVANGVQQVVFARHDKRIQRLPDEVLAQVKEYALPTYTWPKFG
jgi:enediyne biosynthesis thioesterase